MNGKISFYKWGAGRERWANLPHEVTLASVLEADAAGREYPSFIKQRYEMNIFVTVIAAVLFLASLS